MIQLNLLPDVKLKYIKARRNKRLVMVSSISVILVSVGLFVLMFGFVFVVQAKRMKDLSKDIDKGIATIQGTEGVNEILTIQNQLSVVNGKHEEKPAAIRILPYLAQLLPPGSSVTQLDTSFVDSAISVTGSTADINATNKLVDTLKFVDYKTKSGQTGRAFSGVVLGSYGIKPGSSGFSITMKFEPVLFKNTEEVELVIPGIVSTRSSTEKPNIQFGDKAEDKESEQ